jgi:hypothetical protein
MSEEQLKQQLNNGNYSAFPNIIKGHTKEEAGGQQRDVLFVGIFSLV